MKKTVFKYFDMFCYGKLIADKNDPRWFKPDVIDYDTFGYTTDNDTIFYNTTLQEGVYYMFGIGQTEFRELLGEWFEGRYNLPVLLVL
jgi:hypothetical protein